ncbi:MAG: FumA C-terminus/TtdB family hydratase beta subunit [Defluviitaleaceae bacterium]|nr:FumA C-terminus/TtdB family hydratase beta subunit [Defluviitaleaceae bacterium]
MIKEIFTPLSDQIINGLSVGDMVHITGEIYTARDAAHIRMIELLDEGYPLPFNVNGAIVFYAGPCPAPEGIVIGSIGPTTAGRMDLHSPKLISHGLKAMVGKGLRCEKVRNAIVNYHGVYFAGAGGVAALMSKSVKSVEVVAFADLGTEAIRRLTVEKFPVIVAIDSKGRCIYDRERKNPPPSSWL